MVVIIRETYQWVRSDSIKLIAHTVGSLITIFSIETRDEAALESHRSLYKGYFTHHINCPPKYLKVKPLYICLFFFLTFKTFVYRCLLFFDVVEKKSFAFLIFFWHPISANNDRGQQTLLREETSISGLNLLAVYGLPLLSDIFLLLSLFLKLKLEPSKWSSFSRSVHAYFHVCNIKNEMPVFYRGEVRIYKFGLKFDQDWKSIR